MRFSIIGLGYVGLSLAVLLSERYPVTIYDKNSEKMNKVLKKQSPIQDVYIEKYLKEKKLLLKKADSLEEAVHDKDFVILALPTDYDVQTQSFDTSALDEIFKTVVLGPGHLKYGLYYTVLLESDQNIPHGQILEYDKVQDRKQ